MVTFLSCSFVIAASYIFLVLMIGVEAKARFNKRHQGETWDNPNRKTSAIFKLLLVAFCPVVNLFMFLLTILNYDSYVETTIDIFEQRWQKMEGSDKR